MESFGDIGRAMPLYVSLPLSLIYAVLTVIAISRQTSPAVRFLLFAIGFRFLVSAFHTYTFQASPLKLTYNALGTLLAFGVGLLIIRKRRFFNPVVVAVAPLLLVIAISGVANNDIPGMIGVLAKYGYFAVLALAVADAAEDVGADRVFKVLLLPLSLPFAFQLVGIPIGVVKAGESDGSASYIGGFSHESGFSMCLASALLAVCFIRSLKGPVKIGLISVSGIAIMLANYRTTILAMLPLLAITFMTGVTRRFVPRQRPLILGLMLISVACIGALGAWKGADRFGDIAVVLEKGTDIIKPPETFSEEERKLLSGRASIWSNYIYAYYDGSPLQHLVGFGAEAWQGRFHAYAHNTLVSTLYELGVLGVVAMLFLMLRLFLLALQAEEEPRSRLVAAHVGYFILAMATMPLWSVEGLILYGLLCGYTMYSATQRAAVAREEQAADAFVHPSLQPSPR